MVERHQTSSDALEDEGEEEEEEEEGERVQEEETKVEKGVRKDPLYEEDVVEGFSFVSFQTYDDLQNMAKWSSLNDGKFPDPYAELKFEKEEKKIKKKKKKKREKKDIEVLTNTNGEKESSGSNSEKGLICDSDSDAEKKSDDGIDEIFNARKRKLNASGICHNGPSQGAPTAIVTPSVHVPPASTAVCTTSSPASAAAATTAKSFFRPYSISPPPKPPNVEHHPAYRPSFGQTNNNPFYPGDCKNEIQRIPPHNGSTHGRPALSHSGNIPNDSGYLNQHSFGSYQPTNKNSSIPPPPPPSSSLRISPSLTSNSRSNFSSTFGGDLLRRDPRFPSPGSSPYLAPHYRPETPMQLLEAQHKRPAPIPGLSGTAGPFLSHPSLKEGDGRYHHAFPPKPSINPATTTTSFTTPSVQSHVAPKKSGKWNAMHVRIAWEIYNHRHKQKPKSTSFPPSPSATPVKPAKIPKMDARAPTDALHKSASPGRIPPKGPHLLNPFNQRPVGISPTLFGTPPLDALNPYARYAPPPPSPASSATPFGGLGSLRSPPDPFAFRPGGPWPPKQDERKRKELQHRNYNGSTGYQRDDSRSSRDDDDICVLPAPNGRTIPANHHHHHRASAVRSTKAAPRSATTTATTTTTAAGSYSPFGVFPAMAPQGLYGLSPPFNASDPFRDPYRSLMPGYKDPLRERELLRHNPLGSMIMNEQDRARLAAAYPPAPPLPSPSLLGAPGYPGFPAAKATPPHLGMYPGFPPPIPPLNGHLGSTTNPASSAAPFHGKL